MEMLQKCWVKLQKYRVWVAFTLAAVAFIFGVWWFLVKLDQRYSPESISAIFTPLTFGALLLSLRLQAQDLKLTRKELKKTAEANLKTAEAATKTADANIELARLANINLRAQYLSWWIKENKEKKIEKYEKLQKKGLVIYVEDNKCRLEDKRKELNMDTSREFGIVEELDSRFCLKFFRAEVELEEITKLLNM